MFLCFWKFISGVQESEKLPIITFSKEDIDLFLQEKQDEDKNEPGNNQLVNESHSNISEQGQAHAQFEDVDRTEVLPMSHEGETIPLLDVPKCVSEQSPVKQQMFNKSPTDAQTKEDTKNEECTTDGKQISTKGDCDSTQNDSKVESNSIKEFTDYVNDLLKKNAKKQRITFLDFAGHSMYYAFHQIYLSPKTFYILVVDMEKDPNTPCETNEIYGSRFASWTYKGNVNWSTNKKSF